MPDLVVYLARAIDARRQEEVFFDDEKYSKLLASIGGTIVNPFQGRFLDPLQDGLAIAERDLATLQASDLVLADLSIPDYQYVGCIFEIVHAAFHDIPVILVVGERDFSKRIFFQAYCEFIARHADEAIEYIRRAYTSEGIRQQMAEMKAYYSQMAPQYSSESAKTHHLPHDEELVFLKERQELRAVLNKYANGRVCQIGIGTGDWTTTVCDAARTVLAIEQREEMLKLAQVNLAEHLNVEFLRCDILEDEFDAASFDCVVVDLLLGLFPRPIQDRFFQKVCKLVKPGGLLIVVDTKKSCAFNTIGLGKHQLQELRSDDRTYVIYKEHFVGDSLTKLLKRKGYGPIEASTNSVWFSWVVSRRAE
jgi:ubiquinone/menaquinone biosynthesis C-methylase UbiE